MGVVNILRLHVQVYLTDDMLGLPYRINHVIVQCVDTGEDANKTLYPLDGTSGVLSKQGKDCAVSTLIAVIDGLRTMEITYGRGSCECSKIMR